MSIFSHFRNLGEFIISINSYISNILSRFIFDVINHLFYNSYIFYYVFWLANIKIEALV